MTHEAMAQRVAARSRYWNAPVVIDATGGGGSGGSRGREDSHVKTYKAALPEGMVHELFWSSNSESQSKKDIVSYAALCTEQNRFTINPDKFPKIVAQMKRYRVLLSKDRKHIGFGCKDGHDDCVAAVCQALWGMKGWLRDENGLPLSAGIG